MGNRSMGQRGFVAGLVVLLLAGCQMAPPGAEGPAPELRYSAPPPDAGQCWHQEDRPALFETVTEQRQTTGAAVIRESYQRELRPRATIWFRIPCPPEVGGADLYHATLQRALKARGYYAGPVTGVLDAATTAAVRRYQAAGGLDSPVLSRASALSLGLIAH